MEGVGRSVGAGVAFGEVVLDSWGCGEEVGCYCLMCFLFYPVY
jgi:hypothetical protein